MDNKKFPAIRGVIGDWVFYQTVIPFSVVSEIIDNDHSIREYESLNDVLQRDLSKRSKKIRDYLLREDTRFFNSAIIGVFGDTPNWYRFDFAPSAIPNMSLSEAFLDSIGVLELTGAETLFSIDGQHRIDGIKQAIERDRENDSNRFQYDELPVIIVAHNDNEQGKVRTRRLFSEINTKAVRVSGLDDLITNEDNPIDINARKIFSEFAYFEKDRYIALNKTANIDANAEEFTTIINLKEVNKILYKRTYRHLDYRPHDDELNRLFGLSNSFWNQAVRNIEQYRSIFINNTNTVSDYRNSSGGSMLFRPIGIKILAEAYSETNVDDRERFWNDFNSITPDLNGSYWKDILWDNAKTNIKSKVSAKFLREYTRYLLNREYDEEYTIVEYNKLKGIESNEEQLDLPELPN